MGHDHQISSACSFLGIQLTVRSSTDPSSLPVLGWRGSQLQGGHSPGQPENLLHTFPSGRVAGSEEGQVAKVSWVQAFKPDFHSWLQWHLNPEPRASPGVLLPLQPLLKCKVGGLWCFIVQPLSSAPHLTGMCGPLHTDGFFSLADWLFFKTRWFWGLWLGGPVTETVLPMPGSQVQSLVRELDPTCCNWDWQSNK